MPDLIERQLIIENFQDSLRLVRNLMEFSVKEFAEAIGATPQIVTDLETKKIRMSVAQYISIAALTDTYFMRNKTKLSILKAVIDNVGKNYSDKYITSFHYDSLLEKWFENFNRFGEENDNPEGIKLGDTSFANSIDFCRENPWLELVQEYKIFLDVEIFNTKEAIEFVNDLTQLSYMESIEKIILPLRSIEQFKNRSTAEEFEQILNFVKILQKVNVLQVYGEDGDPDFYNTIQAIFNRLCRKYRLCLVTPNEELAYRVLRLNIIFDEKNLYTFSEEEGFNISACFIEDGRVKFYFDETLAEKFEGGYNSPCEGGFKDGADLTSEEETPSKESDRASEEPTKLNGWEEL